MFERKIINDPVFGFINIPKGLLYDVVRHPLLQRLNRIKQLGLSSVVYPGAQHTRFQHSLGAFYLMSEAIQQLATKGNFIFDSEAEAVEAAILMHDIGHGPFSHVLENTIVQGVSHEDISLMLMERINKEMNGQLTLAIQIFKDEYPKRFLHQLVSGQLDMDRLDYLRRDSFYTGVTGSGAFIVGKNRSHVRITGVTVGKIVDYGLKDSQNMGACMAPAACDTIIENLEDFERKETDYDRIITGDLGYVGQSILFDLMRGKEHDIKINHMDCGMTIFDQNLQDTHAGGSGCGCAAATLSAYILPKISRGEWKRVLFVPTGALMSTVSYNEGASVPGIAHGIVLEHC